MVGRVVTGGDGNLGLFGVGRRFGGSGHEVNLVAVFHDSEYADKGFGIDYNYRYNVNRSRQIYGEALFDYYSSDVRESPIARSNYETEVGIGFIYIF